MSRLITSTISDEPPPRPPGPPLSATVRSKNWRLQNQLKQRQLLLGRRRLGLANAAAGATGATTAGLLKKRLGAAAAAAVATGQSQIGGGLNAVKLGTDDSTNVMTR